jgi:hypothetical protein
MGLFDVDFVKVVTYTLPVRLRGTVMQAWLAVLVGPVAYIHRLFKVRRTANLYRLGHNSQVVYMQAVLNDAFDPTLRRITLGDPVYIDAVYLYITPEQRPAPLYLATENNPVPLHTDAEVAGSANGFIVSVPAAVMFDMPRMRALIDKYRLVSKNQYTIQVI